ncbi:MAG: ABC transporter ATP-binding protein [Bacteroidota bacterium]
MLQYLKKVFYVISTTRLSIARLVAAFLFASFLEVVGIGLVGPFFKILSNPSDVLNNSVYSPFFERLGLDSNIDLIIFSSIILVVTFILKSVGFIVARAYVFKFSYNQKVLLESRLLKAYLSLPYTFFLNRNSSGLVQNIAVETQQFINAGLMPLLSIISNLILCFTLVVLLGSTDIVFILVLFAIFVPLFFIFAQLSKLLRKWGRENTKAQKKIIRSINHALGGLKEVKVIHCEDYFVNELHSHSSRFAHGAFRRDIFQVIPRSMTEGFLLLAIVIYILIAITASGKSLEDLTPIFAVFTLASLRLLPTITQLLQAVGRLRTKSYAISLIYSDLKRAEVYLEEYKKTEEINVSLTDFLDSGASQQSLLSNTSARFHDSINLKNIYYSYPNTTNPAIDNISLKIPKGQSIALVGKSGSGKTTLVDILLGLITPSSGDILLDGNSIYKNLHNWQSLLGYIPQSIFLLDGTIEQNIAFGVHGHKVDDVRLKEAVQVAQLEELVSDLPDGLKTQIGERGVRLSGGQRQRIGIARAIYHDCQILVLDEATSALDSQTEHLVSAAIDNLSGSKTLIIIAHRYSTIKNCDRIYQLENGSLKQQTSYEELVSNAEQLS